MSRHELDTVNDFMNRIDAETTGLDKVRIATELFQYLNQQRVLGAADVVCDLITMFRAEAATHERTRPALDAIQHTIVNAPLSPNQYIRLAETLNSVVADYNRKQLAFIALQQEMTRWEENLA
jgi:hypothetical protein